MIEKKYVSISVKVTIQTYAELTSKLYLYYEVIATQTNELFPVHKNTGEDPAFL
jgi:hypothetical protein